MRKRLFGVAAVFMALGLAGCATQWVSADGSSTSGEYLQQARKECQIDDKLYQLSYDRTARDAVLSGLTDEAAKKSVEEIYIDKEKRVHDEIDTCMSKHGFIKAK